MKYTLFKEQPKNSGGKQKGKITASTPEKEQLLRVQCTSNHRTQPNGTPPADSYSVLHARAMRFLQRTDHLYNSEFDSRDLGVPIATCVS